MKRDLFSNRQWAMIIFCLFLFPLSLFAQIVPAPDCTPYFKVELTPTNIQKMCEGQTVLGKITIDVEGGQSPYQYSMDEGITWKTFTKDTLITGFEVGTYYFRFKDSDSCTFNVDEIGIGIEELPDINLGTVSIALHPTCSATDGKLVLQASGGSGSYEYSLDFGANWYTLVNDTIHNVPAGSYAVWVRDLMSTCPPVISDRITLNPLNGPLVAIEVYQNAVDCNEPEGDGTGSLVVTTTGGTPLYAYRYRKLPDGIWQTATLTNGILQGLSTGWYVVEVADRTPCTAYSYPAFIGAPADPDDVLNILVIKDGVTPCNVNAGNVWITVETDLNYSYKFKGEEFGPFTVTGDKDTISFGGLSAGEHVVEVFTDCAYKELRFDVSNSGVDSLVVRALATNVLMYCNDNFELGTITLKVTNGMSTGPFTYTYTFGTMSGTGVFYNTDTTLTGLEQGSYYFTVTNDEGCTFDIDAIEIIMEIVPPLTFGTQHVMAHPSACNAADGEIFFEVNGGGGGYKYKVDTLGGNYIPFTVYSTGGVTLPALTANTYTIIVTDTANNCSDIVSFPITLKDSNNMELNSVVIDAADCNSDDGAIVVSVSGGTKPYTYWLNSVEVFPTGGGVIEDLPAGDYWLVVKDALGCKASGDKLTIGTKGTSAISIAAIVTDSADCMLKNGYGTVEIIASVAFTYQFESFLSDMLAPGTHVITFPNLEGGTYTVFVADTCGGRDTANFTINNRAGGVNADIIVENVKVYCAGQSASGSIYIEIDGGVAPYEICVSKDGVSCTWTEIAGNDTTLNDLWQGFYEVKVRDSEGCSFRAYPVEIGTEIVSPIELGTVFVENHPTSCEGTDGVIKFFITGEHGLYGYALYEISDLSTAIRGPKPYTHDTIAGLPAGSYIIEAYDVSFPTCGIAFSEPIHLVDSSSLMLNLFTYEATDCDTPDGTIIAQANGGTPGYTYTLLDGLGTANTTGVFPNLKAGTYSVRVKDSEGCTNVNEVIIEFNESLQTLILDTVYLSPASCEATDGYAIVAITGATQYEYRLNTGKWVGPFTHVLGTDSDTIVFTGLNAGDYHLLVRDTCGGEEELRFVIKNNESNLWAHVTAGNVKQYCTGAIELGHLSINIAGGDPGYEYRIDTTATWNEVTGIPVIVDGLTEGTYLVEVRDSRGCIFRVHNITIKREPSEPIELGTTHVAQHPTCTNDGSIQFHITGESGTYQWALFATNDLSAPLAGYNWQPYTTGLIENLPAGSYTIKVRDIRFEDCGIAISDAILLIDDSDMTLNLTVINAGDCDSEDGAIVVEITGGTAPYTVTVDDRTPVVFTTNGGKLENLSGGRHTVLVEDNNGNGCTRVADVFIGLENPSGLSADTVKLYAASCTSADGYAIIEITSALKYEYQLNTGETHGLFTPGVSGTDTIALTGLTAGDYRLTVRDTCGNEFILRFVIPNREDGLWAKVTAENVKEYCAGVLENGSLTIKVGGGNDLNENGQLEYRYRKDGGDWQHFAPIFDSITITNLTEGTYLVEVIGEDSCIFKSHAIRIERDPVESIFLGTHHVANHPKGCADDGTIYFEVSGGSGEYVYGVDTLGGVFIAPYTPHTNGLLENLSANTYTVTVWDAHATDCPAQVSFLVQLRDSNSMVLNLSMRNPSACNLSDGYLIVEVSGGTQPYTYFLDGEQVILTSGRIDGLTVGEHVLMVRDNNGCSIQSDVMFAEPQGGTGITARVIESDSTLCNSADGYAIVEITSDLEYTYTFEGKESTLRPATNIADTIWLTGLAAGNYTLFATNTCGGTDTATFTIYNRNGGVNATFDIVNVKEFCSGQIDSGAIAVNITGGDLKYRYRFFKADTPVDEWIPLASGENTITFENLLEGIYEIEITDSTNCYFRAYPIEIRREVQPFVEIGTRNVAENPACGLENGAIEFFVDGGSSAYIYDVLKNTLPYRQNQPYPSGLIEDLGVGSYTVAVYDANYPDCPAGEFTLTLKDSGAIVLALITEPISGCGLEDGALIVSVEDGLGKYAYTLNGVPQELMGNRFINLPSGWYTVTVSDTLGGGNCTDVQTAYIGVDGTVTTISAHAFNVDSASCGLADGYAIIAVETTMPYTYQLDIWSEAKGPRTPVNGKDTIALANLAAGTYVLTLTDTCGATTTTEFTIDNRGVFEAGILAVDVVEYCTGALELGSITITPSGGTATALTPYRYRINDGAFIAIPFPANTVTVTNLNRGTYKVVVVDGSGSDSCVVTRMVPIDLKHAPPVELGTVHVAVHPSTCGADDGEIKFYITGESGNYMWALYNAYDVTPGREVQGFLPYTSNVITGLSAGSYVIVAYDVNFESCGTAISDPIHLTDSSDITLNLLAHAATNCDEPDGEIVVQVKGGTPPYVFAVDGVITSLTGGKLTGLKAGTYSVKVTDQNGISTGCSRVAEVFIGFETGNNGLSVDTVEVHSASCDEADGYALVVVKSTSPYEYRLNTGAWKGMFAANAAGDTIVLSNLLAGDNRIVVRDTCGAEVQLRFDIKNGQSELWAKVIAAHVREYCTGALERGHLTITIDGGTPSYWYRIDTNSTWTKAPATPADLPLVVTIPNLLEGTYLVEVKDTTGCIFRVHTITIKRESAEQIELGTVNIAQYPSCDNTGEISFNIEGGSGNYEWALYTTHPRALVQNGTATIGVTTITGLLGGSYVIEVNDADFSTCGTAVSDEILLIDESDLMLKLTAYNATDCETTDGRIMVNISGGTPGYTIAVDGAAPYAFTTGMLTGLSGGWHTIEVQDSDGVNGCIRVGRVFIELTTSDTLRLEEIEIHAASTCEDADAYAVIGVSGVTQYTYRHNAGAVQGPFIPDANGNDTIVLVGLTAGEHRVVVSDTCGKEAEFRFIVPIDATNSLWASVTPANVIEFCAGTLTSGELIITAGGGVTANGYQYRINGGGWNTLVSPKTVDGLTEGTYLVEVRNGDNEEDCVFKVHSVKIERETGEPFDIASVYVGNHPTCEVQDGSIVFYPQGGSGLYLYRVIGNDLVGDWTFYTDSVIAPLPAGSYRVEVMDSLSKECSTVISKVITLRNANNDLFVSITPISAPDCDGDGALQVTAMGGIPAYEYVLYQNGVEIGVRVPDAHNIISPVPVGKGYTVAVIDESGAGCGVFSDAVDISAPDHGLVVVAVDTIETECGLSTGAIQISITSPTNYTYRFGANEVTSMGIPPTRTDVITISGLAAGSYPVEVWNNCSPDTTLVFTVTNGDDALVATAVAQSVKLDCENIITLGSITLTAANGTAPYTYSYRNQTDGTLITGNFPGTDDVVVIPDLTEGYYDITIMDSKGCVFLIRGVKVKFERVAPVLMGSLYVLNHPTTCGNNDGAIMLYASGGSGAYEYRINSSNDADYVDYTTALIAKNLEAGIYTVELRDTLYPECSVPSFEIALIDSASNIKLVVAPKSASDCDVANGALYLEVTGGTAPYTYQLDTITVSGTGGIPMVSPIVYEGGKISGLKPGKYAVTVTDVNGCTTVAEAIITLDRHDLIVSVPTVINAVCGTNTGSVEINLSSTSSYYYQLYGHSIKGPFTGDTMAAFTGLAAGTYTLQVWGCGERTVTFTVGNNGGFAFKAMAQNVLEYCDGSIEKGFIAIDITGGTPSYSYRIDGGTWLTPLNTPDTLWNMMEGAYKLEVKDGSGCNFEYDAVFIKRDIVPAITIGSMFVETYPTTCTNEDGEIAIYPEGGSGEYEYQVINLGIGIAGGWLTYSTPVIGSFRAGTYRIAIRDANFVTCDSVTSADITLYTFESDLIVNVTATPAKYCETADGKLLVEVKGGKLPYASQTYTFNGEPAQPFSGNIIYGKPGVYVVQVIDADGCVAGSGEVWINPEDPQDITIIAETVNTTCGASTGIARFIVEGTPPYTYQLEGRSLLTGTGNDTVVYTDLSAGVYTFTVTGCGEITRTVTITNTDADAISLIATPGNVMVNCDGTIVDGHIALETSGDVTHYRIDGGEWLTIVDTIQPLKEGTYKIEVTNGDTTCSYGINFVTVIREVVEPIAIGTMHVETHPACNTADGSIALHIEGGSGNYDYQIINVTTGVTESWMPYPAGGLIGGLYAGTYRIKVRDRAHIDCAEATSVAITLQNEDSRIQINVEATPVTTCYAADGTLTVRSVGGKSPVVYTYTYNGGAPVTFTGRLLTGLPAGEYEVSVKDANGCIASSGIVRIVPEGFVSVDATVNIVRGTSDCEVKDGVVTATISSGVTPYFYQLNGEPEVQVSTSPYTFVLSGLAAGSHGLRVYSDCGDSTFMFVVPIKPEMPDQLNVTAVIEHVSELCNGEFIPGSIELTVTGGEGPFEYTIDFWETKQNITSLPVYLMENLTEGKYKVQVRDLTTGCVFEINELIIRIVDFCKLLNCDLLTDKYVMEDAYNEGYRVKGSEWDVDEQTASMFDSLHYYVNGTFVSDTTLADYVFPLCVHEVMVAAWLEELSDTCYFTVTVERRCPDTVGDVELNKYEVIPLAGLCWTENIKSTMYADSMPIKWAKPYYSFLYPDTVANMEIFGLLYTWYSAVGVEEGATAMPYSDEWGNVQGICPEGWHVPTRAEWDLLSQYPADDLKSVDYWIKEPGNNSTGFNARGAGKFRADMNRFEELYGFTGWWASDDATDMFARYSFLTYYCDLPEYEMIKKADGLSVRCILDDECKKIITEE